MADLGKIRNIRSIRSILAFAVVLVCVAACLRSLGTAAPLDRSFGYLAVSES